MTAKEKLIKLVIDRHPYMFENEKEEIRLLIESVEIEAKMRYLKTISKL